VKLIVVRIDDQHVFVHDMGDEVCPAEVIERCNKHYRRQGFTDNLLRFDVVELEPAPVEVEPVA
jgi:hypothetical protein